MNRKKILIIGIICLLIVGAITCFIIFKEKEKNNQPSNDTKIQQVEQEEQEPVSPAKDTEELLTKLNSVETKKITKNEISFSENTEIKEGEKIAVWIYSTPKFLGYFEVVIQNGVKKIEGLAEKLEKLTIESGNHNIALVTEDGSPIGYIDIYIEEDGNISKPTETNENNQQTEEKKENTETEDKKEQTTKEVTYEEEISFKTVSEKEKNMQKDKVEVVQDGVKGLKKVTYNITYDANGKEISRKKISEKTIKEPINKITKVGTSEFNLNTARMTGATHGFMCTEQGLYKNGEEIVGCDDSEGQELKEFYAIKIDNTYYATCANTTGCYGEKVNAYVKLTKVQNMVFKGKLNGTTYYFDGRAGGGDDTPLTQDDCDTFKLTCGTW